MATITGTAGNDTLKGTTGADIFNLAQGGNDTVGGRGGDDVFNFGATFTGGDSVSGDLGTDTINLDGDYSAGIVFHTATLTGVETIVLAAGHSYGFTTVDANIAAGQYLIIDGSALGAGETLHVDGHRELDGHLHLTGGAGDDILSGGANADTLTGGTGIDILAGGGTSDTFVLNGFEPGDAVYGGPGNDSLIATVSATPFVLTNVHSVESLDFENTGGTIDVTLDRSIVHHDVKLQIDTDGSQVTIDGSAIHDGRLHILGGNGSDTLTGGDGNDVLVGEDGNDVLIGGAGGNTFEGDNGADHIIANGRLGQHFIYLGNRGSFGPDYDTISNFNAKPATTAAFELATSVTGIDAAIHTGSLSAATFDNDMAAALDGGGLQANHAVLFTPDAGDMAGDTFLIVGSGGAGYNTGDVVILLDHAKHLDLLSTADFGLNSG